MCNCIYNRRLHGESSEHTTRSQLGIQMEPSQKNSISLESILPLGWRGRQASQQTEEAWRGRREATLPSPPQSVPENEAETDNPSKVSKASRQTLLEIETKMHYIIDLSFLLLLTHLPPKIKSNINTWCPQLSLHVRQMTHGKQTVFKITLHVSFWLYSWYMIKILKMRKYRKKSL